MNEWFDINKILSYRCLISVIIGMRGGGKTYGAKYKCIIDFLEKKQQFIWVRRYDSELEETIKTFFNKIKSDKRLLKKFGEISFHIKNRVIYINEEKAGAFISLSLARKYKSTDFPEVVNVIFDEFIIEGSRVSYLKGEVDMLYGLIETIQRDRDNLRLVLIGNSISFGNPYFMSWKIKPFKSEFLHIKERSLVIQMYWSEEFAKKKSVSRLGKLVDGTSYYEMAIMNKFEDNNNTFIEKKSDFARYRCTIRYDGDDFGVWIDYENGKLYVSSKVDKTHPMRYVVSQKEHNVNYMLVTNYKGTHLNEVFRYYQMGCLFFEDLLIKMKILEMMLYFIK